MNKFIGTAVAIFVSQILIFPLIPASKTASTVTVTVAESEGQAAFPGTVYVYIPAKSIAGLKTPVPLANAGDQVPPKFGFPPKSENKLVGALF